jgi:hypothetical protein
VLATLAANVTDERHLAGGAAMRFAPTSIRYSDDLDFFRDSDVRCFGIHGRSRDARARRIPGRGGAEPPRIRPSRGAT